MHMPSHYSHHIKSQPSSCIFHIRTNEVTLYTSTEKYHNDVKNIVIKILKTTKPFALKTIILVLILISISLKKKMNTCNRDREWKISKLKDDMPQHMDFSWTTKNDFVGRKKKQALVDGEDQKSSVY
ncbi:hypothetical protein Avbf_12464 [Armadillidium vulgare]|nr:hypothetical protein Avbf_12464 [Armadillidium vulgare]